MKKQSTVLLATILLAALGGPLLGDSGEQLKQGLFPDLDTALQNLTDPSLSSPARVTEFQSFVEASREETKVAVEFGVKTKQKSDSTTTLRSAFKLEGPIGKDDDEATLASLEGLGDNVTASYTLTIQTRDPNRAFLAMGVREFDDLICTGFLAERKGATQADCISVGPSLDQLSPAGERAILDAMGLAEGSNLWSLEITYAAPKKYEFVTTESLDKQSQEHDGYSLTAGFGRLPLRKGFYYAGLSYRYEKGHTAGKTQEICQPFGTDLGALTCSELVVGAPTETTRQIGRAEVRKYFKAGLLALNPRYSYDFESDVTGIELPFYFLKDGKGNLNGGITAGWRSDTDDFTLSAFIGTMKNPF